MTCSRFVAGLYGKHSQGLTPCPSKSKGWTQLFAFLGTTLHITNLKRTQKQWKTPIFSPAWFCYTARSEPSPGNPFQDFLWMSSPVQGCACPRVFSKRFSARGLREFGETPNMSKNVFLHLLVWEKQKKHRISNQESPQSVKKVSRTVRDTLGTVSGHSRAQGPKGPGDTLWDTLSEDTPRDTKGPRDLCKQKKKVLFDQKQVLEPG